MTRPFLSVAVSLILATGMTTAWAQGDFPQKGKPISIIVPLAAGGGVDQAARLLASLMEKEVGTSISVVNKPGAGGQVGLTELVRAKPDGYTLGYAVFPFIATSPMDPKRQAIYKRTSFQPIACQYELPKILVVQAGSPYKTAKDLVEAAKANPDKIKAAAGGMHGDTHLGFLLLQKAAAIKFALVHFDGGAPGVTALLGGHVDVGLNVPPEILSHLKGGTLRAIGVTTKQENKFFPGVKTLEAQGYPVYMSVVAGLIAPAGVPKGVVDLLSGAARKVIESADHRQKIEAMGYTVLYQNPDQFAKFWADTEDQLKPIMEEALR